LKMKTATQKPPYLENFERSFNTGTSPFSVHHGTVL
jgi:hypothetical protein